MPYVPSTKTDGKSQDRNILNAAVEIAATKAAGKIKTNTSLGDVYKDFFSSVAKQLHGQGTQSVDQASVGYDLAKSIYEVGKVYGYEGAHLGELNYAITRFIQRVPQIQVKNGDWQPKDEIRYWLYATTIGALLAAEASTREFDASIAGVLHDIKDEYKWRVNRSYEAEQIVKSGDCYDTPFYTRLMGVADESGKHLGYVDVFLARSAETLDVDVLDGTLVFKKKTTT